MHWQAILLILLTALTSRASTEEEARKVLASKCWACHAQTALGGLRLDSREGMLRGGKSGVAVVAGNAAKSRLYQAVARTQPDVKPMPPGVALNAEELRHSKPGSTKALRGTKALALVVPTPAPQPAK